MASIPPRAFAPVLALLYFSLGPPLAAAPVITEFMAANNSSLYDEDGESSDWIELHNPDGAAIDLGGYFLTNDPGDRTRWQLPSPTLLPAGGSEIVFASNKDRDVGELHTNFKLAKDANGYLALVDADGQTIVAEFVDYPEQFEDFSYGLAQTGSTSTQAFVQENDACTVLVPTSDIGDTWKEISYDDTTWREATTAVGYERSGGYENFFGSNADVESETYGTNSTVYLRIPFSIDSLDGLSRLTLRMKYDDGFIAYLNGTEVASGNPPNGPPAWNSDANSDHPDSLAVIFEDSDLTAQAGLLQVGNNLLAIHSLNGDTNSSDLLALPRLEAEFVSDPGLGGPGYFQQPTPGSSNGTNQGLPAGAVEFSIPGRGFSGSLSLSLSTASLTAQIRYTTDGNVPTASSSLFGSAISITSSTLIRARAFESGLAPGPVGEEGYIKLGSTALSYDSDIPVVVMERFSGGPTAANGKTFAFFAIFEPDPRTGRTILNKAYSLGTRGGWKVRGSSSSGFPKKAYSIEAWNEFNRNKDVAPLGLPEESDWILNARSVFDPSLMRNAFIYELSNQIGRYATRTKFVELFKDDNGGDLSFNDYDGVYTFMEKITRDRERVNVERLPQSVSSEPGIAGGYMLKIDRLDPGDSGLGAGGQTLGWVYPKEEDVTSAQANWIRDYLNNMNTALNAPNFADPATGYAQYIDVDSWVDHHLLNVLALNADALRLSTYFFKTRAGKIEFGPIWDFDRSMESTDGRDDNPSTWAGGTNYFSFPWWGRLFADENFWQKYIDRYFELRDGPFSTANVQAIVDGMASELNESQVRNFQRWPGDLPRFGGYQGEVNHLKSWLVTRLSWMDGQFAPRPIANRAAGVYPAGTTVTLSANLSGGRKIFYTLDGSDPRPPSDGSIAQGTILFDETQPIRVLVPTSNIGTSWRGGSEPFDDGGWIAGTNGIGYERSNGYQSFINVDLNAQMANRTSAYVRIPFNVAAGDLASWNFVTLQMRYDDGFVAYLNGTRIGGSNDPANLSFASSATQTNDDASATSYENFNVSAHLGLLQAGENILAIHALNESTGSSDFLNQVRIVAGFDEGASNETGGTEYTGPITLEATSRLFARVYDPSGGHSTGSRQTPVGTGWSAPLEAEFLVNEVPADTTNLVISEIMHDPYDLGNLTTDNGAFEWIELLNESSGAISLTGVAFTEGIDFVFPGRSLAAGDRVLVVRNRSAFEQVYGTGRSNKIAGEFALALDNLGELLTLRAANGSVIQSFAYSKESPWPADAEKGYSLQFDSGDPANGGNWLASRSLLGSPGTNEPSRAVQPDLFVNEVLTNSVSPQVDAIELYNPNAADLDVGGWFLTDELSEPEKFRIPEPSVITGGGFLTFDENDFNATPGVGTSFALDSTGEEIFLIAADPSGARLDYVAGFDFGDASAGVTFGRHVISTGQAHYVPLESATLGAENAAPIAGPLVITELMYHPAPFESEFVEIQNISAQPVPLEGAEVSGIGFVFDPGTPALPPGGIVVLSEIDPVAFRAAYDVPAAVDIHGPYAGRLDNGGERVRVRLPESTGVPAEPDLLVAVDTVIYSDDSPWPASADGLGNSLVRLAPDGYGGEPTNWEASKGAGGTPGVVGSPPTDWRAAFFTEAELDDPQISGFFADPDGDRLVNALEYLLGSDLRDRASRHDLVVDVVGISSKVVELSFTVRDGVTEYYAKIESSPDLRTWSDTSGSLSMLGTTSLGSGLSLVTYRGNDPIDPAQDLYFRIRAVEF